MISSFAVIPGLLKLAFSEYFAQNRGIVLLTVIYPRVALQSLLWVWLARLGGGEEGQQFAMVGVLILALVYQGIGQAQESVIVDKWAGTYGRLLASTLPISVIYAARVVPSWSMSVGTAFFSGLVVSLAVGEFGIYLDFLFKGLHLLLAASVSFSALGFVCASFAVGKRAETFYYNVAIYAVILLSSGLFPVAALASLPRIDLVVPGAHSIQGLRDVISGASAGWFAVGTEVLIAIVLFAVGLLNHARLSRRARRDGRYAFV